MALDPRLHFVVVTGIIVRDDPSIPASLDATRDKQDKTEFLIVKRAPHEKAFPNKWTVPGGKLVLTEYEHLPKTSPTHPQWYNVAEWVLRKEVREEAGIEIGKPQYLCDLVFIRPDGYPVVTLSYWAPYESGEVQISKDFTDSAWIGVSELDQYDLIDGIADEIREVAKLA